MFRLFHESNIGADMDVAVALPWPWMTVYRALPGHRSPRDNSRALPTVQHAARQDQRSAVWASCMNGWGSGGVVSRFVLDYRHDIDHMPGPRIPRVHDAHNVATNHSIRTLRPIDVVARCARGLGILGVSFMPGAAGRNRHRTLGPANSHILNPAWPRFR